MTVTLSIILAFLTGAMWGTAYGLDFIHLFSKRWRLVIALDKRRPGWRMTVASEQFERWLRDQPKDVVAKTSSLKAQDAVDVLDLFYARERTSK